MYFSLLNVVNAMLVLLLSKVQQIAWKGDTPFFPETLTFLNGTTEKYEETLYMDFSVSLQKIENEFIQTWIHPFFGGEIEQIQNQDYVWIGFSKIPVYVWVVCICLFALVFFAAILAFIKKNHRFEITVLSLVWVYNLCLHFIYGSNEAFMYTPHFFFIPFIIISIGFSEKEHSLLGVVLVLIGLLEMVSNLITYRKLISMIVCMLGTTVYTVKVVFANSLVLGFFLFVLGILLCDVIKRVITVKKDVAYKQWEVTMIIFYAIFISVSAFWVYINC